MDQRERANEFQEALRAALDGRLADLWTSGPGIIEAVDADRQVATVQPAIQRPYRGPDGTVQMLTLPLLLDCPVQFPSGGGVTLTFPVAKGDECLVVFGARCMDSWWQSGGIQPPAEFRMHSLSDGYVIPGVRSQPRKLTAVSTTKAQLRNDAGDTFVELDPAGKTLHLTAPNGATIDANTTINGSLHVTGDITCDATVTGTADVVGGSKSLKTHVHTDPQGGNTGAPV
jgi:hypothetical protein